MSESEYDKSLEVADNVKADLEEIAKNFGYKLIAEYSKKKEKIVECIYRVDTEKYGVEVVVYIEPWIDDNLSFEIKDSSRKQYTTLYSQPLREDEYSEDVADVLKDLRSVLEGRVETRRRRRWYGKTYNEITLNDS